MKQPSRSGWQSAESADGCVIREKRMAPGGRLKASLTAGTGRHPEGLTDDLLITADRWSGRQPGDDLTLVLVGWNEQS
jgi:hypothetical protein